MQIAETINAALAVHFPPDYDAHIIAEPGRYYSAGAFTLTTNIIAKSTVPANKITGQGEMLINRGQLSLVVDESCLSQCLRNGGMPADVTLLFFSESDANQTANMFYMNDGVYGSFNCILFDHVTPIGKPLLTPRVMNLG